MTDAARTSPQRSSVLSQFILAPNPGPMSLDGTNSYLLRRPDSPGVVVVDPGPWDEDHLQALAGQGRVDLILVTHRHADHTAGSRRLHELTGAPVRAVLQEHCHGGLPLRDGEAILAAGVDVTVLATPGHTSDSVCFHLPADQAGAGSVLTGDTILGRGTTMLDFPDGTLGDYLASLDRLAELGAATVLPAHGPALPSVAAAAAAYREHRQGRLEQVRAALQRLGRDATAGAVADAVYADVDRSVRRAAELSVAAQLQYLRAGGGGQ